MKKKSISAISLLIVLTMLCTLLSGCVDTSNTKKFSTESDMINALNGTWVCEDHIDETILVINGDSFGMYVMPTSSARVMETFLEKSRAEWDDMGDKGTVNYYCRKGYIKLVGTETRNMLVNPDNTLVQVYKDSRYYYEKINTETKMPPQIIFDIMDEYKRAKEEAAILENKKNNSVNCKDFKYNPFNYVGKNVYIEGTAELDTYYNWGYINVEPICFCICVTPQGGSFTDSYYIYAKRDEFSDLFEELKGGAKNVVLFYNPWFYEGYEHDMGWLTDFYVQ